MTAVAGILVFIGSIPDIRLTLYPKIFLLIISAVGFFFNYSLRVPFYKFAMKAELIAIKEFSMDYSYRRFFESSEKTYLSKKVDTFDIFAVLYLSGIATSIYLVFENLWFEVAVIPFLVKYIIDRINLNRIRRELAITSNTLN
jgi:hypothetical protein